LWVRQSEMADAGLPDEFVKLAQNVAQTIFCQN
jgi:hypothetical protein